MWCMSSVGDWLRARLTRKAEPLEPLTGGFDDAVSHAREVYERAGDWEAALAWLRAEGFGQARACLATCRVLGVDLGEAKRIVTFSPAWEDRIESNAALEEALLAAFAQGTGPDPLSIEIWSEHAPAAYRAFLGWAESRGSARVVFAPDPMLGIDSEQARGFLVDDVYLLSIWIDRGADAFMASLESELLPDAQPISDAAKKGVEPNPEKILRLIIDNGQDIGDVRHRLTEARKKMRP